MLKIPEQALEALAVGQEESFERRVQAMLADEYAVPPAEHPALLEGVRRAIADARGFGLVKERSVATYCVVAFLAGLQIRDDPKVRGNLGSAMRSEGDKIAWLKDWILALEAALDS